MIFALYSTIFAVSSLRETHLFNLLEVEYFLKL